MILVDLVRVAAIALAVAIVTLLLRRWPALTDRRERVELLGVIGCVAVLAGSRLANLGHPITWQLPIGTVALVAIGYSVFTERADARRRRRA